jgi:Undecaprenyl-phosphate glucose phosphotransferase
MMQATEFYSRGSVVAQYVAGLATAVLVRMLLARFAVRGLDSGAIRGRKVVVIGEQDSTATVMRWLACDGRGADVIKIIPLAPAEAARSLDGWQQAIAQTRSALREIEGIARHSDLDDVVIALPWTQNDRIEALVEGLAAVPATIHLAPDYALNRRHPVLARVGNMHTLRLSRAPLTLKDHVIKRIFDVTVASALLIAAAPFLLLIALAIRLDSPGPVLFRQRRNGFNQHEFRVFKFRTMTTLDDGHHVPQATRNDARVTRIGRILRRTNLDEVPQLLNVIAGDMSLVGPRPHAVAHNNAYEERIRLYARRHNVKPGITGWAQVNGYRGETDTVEKMARRVEHDLYYIDHWSVLLDIRVLLMTIFSLRSYRNAY